MKALGRLLVGGEGVKGGQLVRARAAGKGAAADRAQRLLGAVVVGQRDGVVVGDKLEGVQAREGAGGAAQRAGAQVGAVVAVVAGGGAVVAEEAHQWAALGGRRAATARLRAPIVGRRRPGDGGGGRADVGTRFGEVQVVLAAVRTLFAGVCQPRPTGSRGFRGRRAGGEGAHMP